MNEPKFDAVESSVSDEMKTIPYEPQLPAEIKLIVGSLSLGIVLLAILVWATRS
jgi:hypothetical protein